MCSRWLRTLGHGTLLAIDRAILVGLLVLLGFAGSLALSVGYQTDVRWYQLVIVALNAALGVQCITLWRRADPAAPAWWYWALVLSNVVVVCTLRGVAYTYLGNGTTMMTASSTNTEPQYKLVAMLWVGATVLHDLLLPYLVYSLSPRLSQAQKHVAVFGCLLIAYGVYTEYALYYQDKYVVQYAWLCLVAWMFVIQFNDRVLQLSSKSNNAYIMLLSIFVLWVPEALGAFMFQLLIVVSHSVTLEVACVAAYHVGAYFTVAVWEKTAEFIFPSFPARSSFDFIVRWYTVLFAELVFVQLQPSSPSFVIVLVLFRARDLFVRTGWAYVVWEDVIRPYVGAVDVGPVALRRMKSWVARPQPPMSATVRAEVWFHRWRASELSLLSGLAATLTVLLALWAETVVERNGWGRRILSLHVPGDQMWELWLGFAFILSSRLLVSVIATTVHRRRVVRLRGLALSLSRGSLIRVSSGDTDDDEEEIMPVPTLLGVEDFLGSPVNAWSDPLSPAAVAPEPLPSPIATRYNDPNTPSATAWGPSPLPRTPLKRVHSRWPPIGRDFPRGNSIRVLVSLSDETLSAAPLFWLQDPLVMSSGLVSCIIYSLAKVYEDRALELAGKLK